MEAAAAIGLAASILTVAQFSLAVIIQTKSFYNDDQSRIGFHDIARVKNDLIAKMRYMQVSSTFGGPNNTLKPLYESCLATAEELAAILDKFSIDTKGKRWRSFKRAMLARRYRESIASIVRRLEAIRGEIHFSLALVTQEEVARHTQILGVLQGETKQVLEVTQSRPKDFGYPWETGILEEYIKIDDGLCPEYFLPLQFCENLNAFYDILEVKFSSRSLPGLPQIQKRHLQVLEWNERHCVTPDTWLNVVKGDRAIKVSFVMGSWCGPTPGRCLRCGEPRAPQVPGATFKSCHACRLAVQWVEPETFPFEPIDVIIGDEKTFTDFQNPTRSGGSSVTSPTISEATSHESEIRPPSIDLTSHRLTIKWEPFFNIVHRYMFCRCVARLSTPSFLVEEMTILVSHDCPRHNTTGEIFQDYDSLVSQNQNKAYFERFGGYNAFWALLKTLSPKVYEALDGENTATPSMISKGLIDLDRLEGSQSGAIQRMNKTYWYDIIEIWVSAGVELPPQVVAGFVAEREKRDLPFGTGPDRNRDFHIQEMAQTPMVKQLEEIVAGKWDGVPHWKITD